RSLTRSTFDKRVTPGASSVAAICFNPRFFVAPDTRTRPESGSPATTTNASDMLTAFAHGTFGAGRLLDEAEWQLFFAIGCGDAPDLDRLHDAGNRAESERHRAELVANCLRHLRRRQDLAGPGGVAQTRRKVDRHADEVVALEEDHGAGRDPDA